MVITPLEHMDEDGAVKMGMSFVPTLRMKSQPAGGVLMWVNQYPALKEVRRKGGRSGIGGGCEESR